MKKLIQEIHKIQSQKTYSLQELKQALPTKQRGLYWLWTDLSDKQLGSVDTREETAEVPISKLVTQRKGLNNITGIEKDGFRIVYNGIGGYRNTLNPSFGLRERVNQEFNSNHPQTGTLNISRRFNNNNWRVSFFNFDDKKNKAILSALDTENPYTDFANDLEIIWRLEYGTPILCRY